MCNLSYQWNSTHFSLIKNIWKFFSLNWRKHLRQPDVLHLFQMEDIIMLLWGKHVISRLPTFRLIKSTLNAAHITMYIFVSIDFIWSINLSIQCTVQQFQHSLPHQSYIHHVRAKAHILTHILLLIKCCFGFCYYYYYYTKH